MIPGRLCGCRCRYGGVSKGMRWLRVAGALCRLWASFKFRMRDPPAPKGGSVRRPGAVYRVTDSFLRGTSSMTTCLVGVLVMPVQI